MTHFNASNTQEFIRKAVAKHGDLYAYDKTIYETNTTKILIYCAIHEYFEQTPMDHLSGRGCKECGKIQRSITKRENAKKAFNQKAIDKHGDLYCYESVDYVNATTKVQIYCRKHEESFWQLPSTHLHGQGCPTCGQEKITASMTSNTAEFIEKARLVHADKYDYSLVKYTKSCNKISIYCKKHNSIFAQRPNDHLRGRGCFKCGRGKETENLFELYLIETYPNLEFIREYAPDYLYRTDTNKKCRYDFFIPALKLNIEIDGEQHVKPVKFWGGQEYLDRLQEMDAWKDIQSDNNGVTVVRIPYSMFSKKMHRNDSRAYFDTVIVPIIDDMLKSINNVTQRELS